MGYKFQTNQGVIADAVVDAGAAGTVHAKLRRISTDIDAIKTAVQILDNVVSGTEQQVDVVTINTVAPQFDDTDKMAVSLYGKASAAGDKEVLVDASGHVQVDALTLPASIQGAGNPTIDSYNTAAINAAAAADQELVADPGANKQIWVYGLFMMADTGAGTVQLQDDAGTAMSGVMAVSDEGGWVLPPSGNFAMPWIKVTTNKALDADCSTSTIDGIICYAIVSV